MHLNAGSTLKYPVKFLPKMERQVFLNGEAFFEVTKDTKNLFVVHTSEVNIQVYGTKFNVNAYNAAGQMIYSGLEYGSKGVIVRHVINNSAWNQGYYIVTIETGGEIERINVIK